MTLDLKSLTIKTAVSLSALLAVSAAAWKVWSDRKSAELVSLVDYYADDLNTYAFPSDTSTELVQKANDAIGKDHRLQGVEFYMDAIRNQLLSGEENSALANVDYVITLSQSMSPSDKEQIVSSLIRVFRSVRTDSQHHKRYAAPAELLKRALKLKQAISQKPDLQLLFILNVLPKLLLDEARQSKDEESKKNLEAEATTYATDAITAARSIYGPAQPERERVILEASHAIDAAGNAQQAHIALEAEKKDIEQKCGPESLQVVPLLATMALIEKRLTGDTSALLKQAATINKIAQAQHQLFLKDEEAIKESAWDVAALRDALVAANGAPDANGDSNEAKPVASSNSTDDSAAREELRQAYAHLSLLAGQQAVISALVQSLCGVNLNQQQP